MVALLKLFQVSLLESRISALAAQNQDFKQKIT